MSRVVVCYVLLCFIYYALTKARLLLELRLQFSKVSIDAFSPGLEVGGILHERTSNMEWTSGPVFVFFGRDGVVATPRLLIIMGKTPHHASLLLSFFCLIDHSPHTIIIIEDVRAQSVIITSASSLLVGCLLSLVVVVQYNS